MPPKNTPSKLQVTPPFNFLAKLEHQRLNIEQLQKEWPEAGKMF